MYKQSIDNLLSASPTGDYLSIFSTFDTVGSTSRYNTNLWGGGGATLDWTGICWKQTSDVLPRGVAITKRHVIVTDHGGHTVGETGTWIKTDGTLVTRTFSDYIHGIGAPGGVEGDGTSSFRVMYLSSDLPAGIATYQILGDDRVPSFYTSIPGIKLDAEHKGLICRCLMGTSNGTVWMGTTPLTTPDSTYYENSISGDSGKPMFLLNGTTLLYASTLTTTGGGGSGPFAVTNRSAIYDACVTLDARNAATGYRPTLSGPLTQIGSKPSIALGV